MATIAWIPFVAGMSFIACSLKPPNHMKKFLFSPWVILPMAALFLSCEQEELQTENFGQVRFSLTVSGDHAGERNAIPGLSPDTYVQLSLEGPDGGLSVVNKRLQIVSASNGYMTESIDLPPGNYSVTDLVVVNKSSETLYAVEEGTRAFTVGRGAGSPIAMAMVGTPGEKSHRTALKEFVINDRHYEIYYNRWGDIDSIVAHQEAMRYVYRVTYTDGRIDSVGTYDQGQYVSVHDDFVYDKQGRILSYNYYPRLPGYPQDYADPTTVTYDNRGRIAMINGWIYTYDNHSNVVMTSGSQSYMNATYTYDKGKNPFYPLKELFAIVVEEPFMWEFFFSRNNITSKTDASGTKDFVNAYDSRNRLISSDGMLFFYN